MTVEDTLKEIQLSILELGSRLDNVERNSHPPVFKEESYEELDARLQVIEAFYNSIKLITTNKEELE
tara:strand:+ start:3145 stop:3345 length:201 start_codon:yes stop_codon:yes gene_type:complete